MKNVLEESQYFSADNCKGVFLKQQRYSRKYFWKNLIKSVKI